jgi:thymidylate synthase
MDYYTSSTKINWKVMNKWSNYGKWRHHKKRKELMKNIDIKNNTLDKQYQSLLQDILDNGVSKKDRTGTGTISVFGRQIRHKMSEGFPLLTTKKMPFRLIATELMWFLRGDTNIKYLVDNNCHIWDGDAYNNYSSNVQPWEPHLDKNQFVERIKTIDEFAKTWGDLGPVYGAGWRNWDGIDQIQELINTLKTNPDSRRMLVSAWNVGELDQMVLPPCHYGFQVYTRELSLEERLQVWNIKFGFTNEEQKNQFDPNVHLDTHGVPTRAISLMWNQRSVDTFLGLPFNIASYGLLLEILAKEVNMVPDELIGNLGDTHLYLNHIEQAKEQIGREPYTLPTLNINTEFWPTESGECGTGLLDAIKIFNSFTNDNFCKCLLEEDIQLSNYKSHEKINAPLSN